MRCELCEERFGLGELGVEGGKDGVDLCVCRCRCEVGRGGGTDDVRVEMRVGGRVGG